MKFKSVIPIGTDGLKYTLPKMPPENEIEGYDLPKKNQKYRRKIFLTDEEFKKLTKESQLEILTTELIRRTEGYWFFNNGIPTYLTGSHYFYLNYWYIAAVCTQDGLPEYREAQTKWMYFIDLCDKDPMCFGGIMMSGKRFSKTEAGLAHLYNQATLLDTDCLFGMQSLTATEAKNNLFKGRILRSHRRIPSYLKPKSNDSIGKSEISSELTFMSEKKGDVYKQGLNNKLDWRPTNASAYQGKRPKGIYWDEPGTMEEMDIVEALSTVKQQLQIGKKAFGKIYMPATLESMTPKGAPLFQQIWNESDPNIRDENGRTISWLYRYFNPQYEGREDFIDEYGNSLVEEAKKFRANELKIASDIGARKIKRQYPENPDEAFDVVFVGQLEEDVIEILKARKTELLNNPVEKKGVVFYKKEGNIEYSIKTKTDDKVVIYEDPQPNVTYVMGLDGTATDKQTNSAAERSGFSFTVLKAFEGYEKTNYTVAAEYFKVPDKIDDSYNASLYTCEYFNKYGGIIGGVLPETNAGGAAAINAHFTNRGAKVFMKNKPNILGASYGNKDVVGLYRDEHVKKMQIIFLNKFIRLYGHNLPSIELIDDILNIGKKNTDRADSFMMAICALGNFETEKKKVEIRPTRLIPTIKEVNGVMSRVMVNPRMSQAELYSLDPSLPGYKEKQ